MPYIMREDGERFIIPSYRDVLSAKKPALLKKEVTLLSSNYGEYITLQRKNADQYEAAFSPEPGYLLGETVWHYFKRPKDLIYCEAIPNTTDAVLVIVKGGSVYLDGSFPVDSIPDELIVFRTQQSYFEIYIHGDIPLSQEVQEGKFSLDTSSVKSFTILPAPIFPTLPTIKTFQLRLVDVVLKSHGIGVFPYTKLLVGLVIIGTIWVGISYLSLNEKELPSALVSVVNPYQAYENALRTPSPTAELMGIDAQIAKLFTIPGWIPTSADYASGILTVGVKSSGAKLNILYMWAAKYGATLQIQPSGVFLILPVQVYPRPQVRTISPLQQVLAEILDRISTVIPGNSLTISPLVDQGRFFETQCTISFTDFTLNMVGLLADKLKGLPLALVKVNISINNGTLSGVLVLKALGN